MCALKGKVLKHSVYASYIGIQYRTSKSLNERTGNVFDILY